MPLLSLPIGGGAAAAAHARKLAYRWHRTGAPITLLFLPGFRSVMTSKKAEWMEAFCKATNMISLCFDYSGHGLSAPHSPEFTKCNLSLWKDDAHQFMRLLRREKQRVIIVASSMGGWIAHLLALDELTSQATSTIAGILTIGCAPDFTEALLWNGFTPEQQARVMAGNVIEVASAYSPNSPTLITRELILDGRKHLLLSPRTAAATSSISKLRIPITYVHGKLDVDVPWEFSAKLAERMGGNGSKLVLVEDGDHRLSQPNHLAFLECELKELIDRAA